MWSTGFELLPVQLHGIEVDETELMCPPGVLALGKELMNGKYILKKVSFWCDVAQLPGSLCSCTDLYQVRILPSWDKSPLLCHGVLWTDVLQGGLTANPWLSKSPEISSEEGSAEI